MRLCRTDKDGVVHLTKNLPPDLKNIHITKLLKKSLVCGAKDTSNQSLPVIVYDGPGLFVTCQKCREETPYINIL